MLGVRIVFCLGENGYHGLLAELLPVTWDMLEHGGAVQHTLAQLPPPPGALGFNRSSRQTSFSCSAVDVLKQHK